MEDLQVDKNSKEKRIKTSSEEEELSKNNNSSTTTNNNRETSADTSKENSKASEVQKPGYIHVRAGRGQASDSHSLAERVSQKNTQFHHLGCFFFS